MLAPYSILTVPTFAARCLSASYTMRELQAAKCGSNCGRETSPVFCLEMPTSTIHSRVLLHAVNLRHGTDVFTSPPKRGVLRIFFPLKIRRLRPGLNQRTWVLKANTLHLLLLLELLQIPLVDISFEFFRFSKLYIWLLQNFGFFM